MLARSSAAVSAALLLVAACGGGDDDAAPETDDAPVTTEPATTEPATTEPATTEPPTTEAVDDPVETTAPPDTDPPATDAPEAVDNDPRCADSVGGFAEMEFDEVPCDEPHNAEFAGTAPAPVGALVEEDIAFDIEMSSVCLESTETLLGEPIGGLGLEIAYSTAFGPGDDPVGDVECWLRSAAIDSMTGSLRDADLDTVLGDFVTLATVEFGECFLPAPDRLDSIGVGTVEDCSTVGVDQILGVVTLDDGPFPGQDEIFDIGFEECPALDSYTDVTPMGDTPDVIAPFETEWEVLGARQLLCTSYRAADFEDPVDPTESADVPQCFLASEGDAVQYEDEVSCDEPHDAELAGFVEPPVEVLPADSTEAAFLMRQTCRGVAEELTGRDAADPGYGVGFSVNGELGEPIEGDVACYVEGRGIDLLVGSMRTADLATAYGDARIVADLDAGTCFTFAPESVDIGDVVDCTEPGALMVIGQFRALFDEYPGLDELRAHRNEVCGRLLFESGLSADPATISGTITNENEWTTFGGRLITCDGVPI